MLKLLAKNSRLLASITLFTAIIGTATAFLLTPKFKATASALAGNSLLHDKARLTNPNIKDLYSYFGNTDDLDRLRAIAESDTILHTVFMKHKLGVYYNQDASFPKLNDFKKDLFIRRSDKDQLLISVELPNPQTAADVANDIAAETNTHLQSLIRKEEDKIIQVISNTIQKSKDALTNKDISEIDKIEIHNMIINQERNLQEWKEQQTISPNFLIITEYANPNRAEIVPHKALLISLFTIGGFVIGCCIVALKSRLA